MQWASRYSMFSMVWSPYRGVHMCILCDTIFHHSLHNNSPFIAFYLHHAWLIHLLSCLKEFYSIISAYLLLTSEMRQISACTEISGIATGVARRGRVPPLTVKKFPKIGKNQEKIGEKSGKKRENREEKAKIGKFLSLCPSWQLGLATLLTEIWCIGQASKFSLNELICCFSWATSKYTVIN